MNDLVKSSASTNDFEDNGIKLTPVEGNTSTHEYLYDGNGNMIQDKNKNITVTYNYMNLPTMVNFGGGNKIEWIYSVSGAKLRKNVYTNNALTLTQDYVSGFVYKNSQLDFFGMEEGRVKKLANGSLQYQYTIKDHLGNTRVMFADTNSDNTADLLEESHYYAFGSRIEGLSSSNIKNKFTYNGKELEDDFNLNWYHYGARYYDPALGKWMATDPSDELTSPYTYSVNNPLRFIDPDGKKVTEIVVNTKNQTATIITDRYVPVTIPIAVGPGTPVSGTFQFSTWDRAPRGTNNFYKPWVQDNENPFGPRAMKFEGLGGINLHGTAGPLYGGLYKIDENVQQSIPGVFDQVGPKDRIITNDCIRVPNAVIEYIFSVEGVDPNMTLRFSDQAVKGAINFEGYMYDNLNSFDDMFKNQLPSVKNSPEAQKKEN